MPAISITAGGHELPAFDRVGPRRVVASQRAIAGHCDDHTADENQQANRAEPERLIKFADERHNEDRTEQDELSREPELTSLLHVCGSCLLWAGLRVRPWLILTLGPCVRFIYQS